MQKESLLFFSFSSASNFGKAKVTNKRASANTLFIGMQIS